MEVTATKTDNANVRVDAKITKNDIDKKVDKIAKQAAKQMNIDGFRPGKAPVSIVKKRLGDRLVQDAESEALREVLESAKKELGLDAERIIGEPAVTKFEKKEELIEVELKLSLKPEFEIEDIDELIPEVDTPDVSEDEVEKRLEELSKAQAPYESIDEDRGLKDEDKAIFDFEGFIEGEPFEGGRAENFELVIGSNQLIPGFEKEMEGMKKGEAKRIKVTFPENYGKKELAGKEAEFDIKLHDIQERKPVEINDELAKKLLGDEEATLSKLKSEIKEQIKSEKLNKLYSEELKPKLVEALVEKFAFDLPQSVVEQEIEMSFRNRIQQMSDDEIEELRNSEEKVKEIRESLREDAQKSVKATFIIDALARKEGVEVSEQEMMQTIYYEAISMGQDPKQTFEYYQKQNLLPAIKMAMIEDRLLTKLLNDKNEKSQSKEETKEKEEV